MLKKYYGDGKPKESTRPSWMSLLATLKARHLSVRTFKILKLVFHDKEEKVTSIIVIFRSQYFRITFEVILGAEKAGR